MLFVTDGTPSRRRVAQETLRELSQKPVFWQFVGVGGGRFGFLQRLANLRERAVDNSDFFAFADPAQVSDGELYARLMDKYPVWWRAVRAQGWL